jgi:hypothetical protein
MPEWLKGADCKSAGLRLRWFESSSAHHHIINDLGSRKAPFLLGEDPHQRDLGEVILRHIGEGIPISFRYAGGSEPGAVRTVLPTLLFSPDLCPYRMCYEDPTELPDPSETPIYLLGWCQTRQAARTFRLDRMEIVETSAWSSKLTGKPD